MPDSEPARPGAAGPRGDAVVGVARALLLVSIFLSSLLVLRVGDYTAGDLVLGVAVASALFAAAAVRRTGSSQRLPVLTLLILTTIVAGGVLSGLRAQSTSSTLAVVVRLVLVVVVLPWLAARLFDTAGRLRRALTAFAAGAGFCGGGTVLQFFLGASIIPNTSVTNAGRFAGFTQNVSDTGGICCAGLVTGAALFASATMPRARIVPALAALGSAFGLLLSGSVSGLIATVLGLVVLRATGVLRPRAIIASVIAFAAILVVVLGIQNDSGALNPLQRIQQTTGLAPDDRYNTAGSRLSTYTSAVDGVLRNPLIGSGLDPSSTIADGIYPAHNLFIGAAFDGGLLLLVGIVLAVLRPFLLGALRAARRGTSAATALAALVTELFFAMTAPSLYNRYLWIPAALLIAATALHRRADVRATDGPGRALVATTVSRGPGTTRKGSTWI